VSSSSEQRNVRRLVRELHPKHEGNTIIRNVGNYSPIAIASHTRGPEISGLTTYQYDITTRHDKVLYEQGKNILKKLTNGYSHSQRLKYFIYNTQFLRQLAYNNLILFFNFSSILLLFRLKPPKNIPKIIPKISASP
jgi:hypothetical protein